MTKKISIHFNLLFSLILLIFVTAGCQKENTPQQSSPDILHKKYNEVCFLMTHNAMNNTERGFTTPNQTHSVTHQLKNGVRGLMIDTYDGSNGIALTYHAVPAFGQEKLVDVLQEIKTFLLDNNKEVITIIFENNGSNVQLEKAIDSIGLNNMTFIHQNGDEWPILQTMVDSSQRLVLFVETNNLPRANYLMHAWSTIFDTKFTYTNINQFDAAVNRGGGGSKELYLINHWLQREILPSVTLPDSTLAPQANVRSVVSKRVQNCAAANSHLINFLGVDFYHIGDAKVVVDSINYSN